LHERISASPDHTGSTGPLLALHDLAMTPFGVNHSAEEVKCIDMMVWIGQTYRTVEEYIREAERRGCCREIPEVPPWARPGETKVFLIHRDGRAPHQGSIFGYFILERLEIVTPGRQFSYWPPLGSVELAELRKIRKRQELKKRLEKHKRKYRQYVAQRKTRPRLEPRDPGDDPLDKIFKEWLKQLLRKRSEGDCEPVPDDFSQCEPHRSCSQRLSPGAVYVVDALAAEIKTAYEKALDARIQTQTSQGRTRSDVLKDLRQETNDAWIWWRKVAKGRSRARILAQLVEAEEPSRKWWETVATVDGGAALRTLRRTPTREWHWWRAEPDPFREVADRVLSSRTPSGGANTQTRKLLGAKKAMVRGELVVFKRPFPIFEHAPQAAFRGINRIDGDELLRQVANGVRKPVISYCGEEMRDDEIRTQSQLVGLLSSELHVSEALARRYFKRLAELATVNLQANREFNLPNLGRLVVRYWKARTGRNPQTGKKLLIPAKHVVRFRPTKALRDKIAPLPPRPRPAGRSGTGQTGAPRPGGP